MDSHCSVPFFECQTTEGDTVVQQPLGVGAARVVLFSAAGSYGLRLRWLLANNSFMKLFQWFFFLLFDTYGRSSFRFIVKRWCKLWGEHCNSNSCLLGEMWFLWSQAVDSDMGAWASRKSGGLLHLEVDQTQKYSGDDNKMSWRRVKISVCPAFVALLNFFFPSHLFFSSQWATRLSQAFAPRSHFLEK